MFANASVVRVRVCCVGVRGACDAVYICDASRPRAQQPRSVAHWSVGCTTRAPGGFPVFLSSWQASKITAALREYQRLWHQSWLAACSSVRPSFGAFVLVRHAETSELFANFDQQMIQLVVEGRWCAALSPACRPTCATAWRAGCATVAPFPLR